MAGPGNLEKLSVQFETNVRTYVRDMSTASKATKGWAEDTEKAGTAVQGAEKKATSAFGRISQAIRGVRSDASKGADFQLRADEKGLSGITSRIKGIRSDAERGASMKLSAEDSGLRGAQNRIAGVRSEASKGATMKVSADDSEVRGLEGSIRSVGETAAGVAGGIALEDIGSGMADNFRTASGAVGGFQGRLDATQGQAQSLASVGRNVFAGAWGGSLAEVNDAVTTVSQGLGTMGNEAKTQRLTEQALTLSDAFGMDVKESVEAARLMSQNFGIDAERAFDLVTAGAQRGANTSDDLLDSLREYSTYFDELGLSGNQAMGMFVEGAERGIWNTDKLADAVKEFSIRAVDGTELTAEGFEAAGLNADKMAERIAAGGPTAEKAFGQTVDALLAIEDPLEREKAAVALFGTQFEDLGPQALKAMDQGVKGLDNVDGATKRAGDSLYDNFTTRLMEATRRVQMFATESGLGPLGSTLGNVAESAGFAGLAVMGLGPIASRVAPLIGGAGLAGSLAAAGGAVGSFLVAAAPFIAAAAALALGAYLIYRNWDKVGPVFQKAVDGISGAAGRLWNWLEPARENLSSFFQWLPGAAGAAWKWTEPAREKIGAFLSWVGEKAGGSEGLQKIWSKLSDDKGAIENAKGKLGPFFTWLGEQASESEGLQKIWAKLSDDKGAIDRAKELLGPFFSWLSEKAAGSEGLQKIWSKLNDDKGAIENVKAKLGPFFSWLSEKASKSEGLNRIWSKLSDDKGALANAKEKLGGFFTWLGQRASKSEGLQKIWSKLKDDKGAIENVKSRFGAMAGWLKNKAGEISTNVGNKFNELKTKGGQRFSELKNSAQSRFSELKNNVVSRATEAKTNVLSRFSELKTQAGTRFSELRDNIGARMSEAKTRAGDRASELKTKTMEIFNSMPEPVKSAFQKVGDGMVGPIEAARSALSGIWNSILEGIAKVLSAVGLKGLAGDVRGAKWNPGTSGANNPNNPNNTTTGSGKQRNFARGGLYKADRGGIAGPGRMGLVGEAGQDEAIVNLERRTPESQAAFRAAAQSPNARPEKASERTHRHAQENYRRGRSMESYGPTMHTLIPPVRQIAESVASKYGTPWNTYSNHPPGYAQPYYRERSVDWWGPGGRGDPIGSNWTAVADMAWGLSDKSGWMLHPGNDPGGHGGAVAHVHLTTHVGVGGESETGSPGAHGGGQGGSGLISQWAAAGADALWNRLVQKPYDNATKGLESGFVLKQGAKKAGQNALDGIKEAAMEKAGMTSGSSGPYEGGGNLDEWAKNGLILGGAFPANPTNIEKIKARAMQESGGDPNAVNNWDSNAAAGTPSKGLMQIIEPTWTSNTTPEIGNFDSNWNDPVKSVGVASRYMKSRYGYVVGATGSGYRRGGVIPGPAGMPKMLMAHAGERVLPRALASSFDRLADTVELWSRRGTGALQGGGGAPDDAVAASREVRDEVRGMRADNNQNQRLIAAILEMLPEEMLESIATNQKNGPRTRRATAEGQSAHQQRQVEAAGPRIGV